MAVAKMEFINIIGHLDAIEEVCKRIVLSSSIHQVNAMLEINENNFPILQAKDDVDALIDYNYIRPYQSSIDLNEIKKIYDELVNIFEIKKQYKEDVVLKEYSFNDDIDKIRKIYNEVSSENAVLKELEKQYKRIVQMEEYLKYLRDIDINLNELLNMRYFSILFGKLSNYNMDKLKKNYENISAIVFKLYQDVNTSKVMVLMPKEVYFEVKRVLNSLEFEEFSLCLDFNGNPYDCINEISTTKQDIILNIRETRDKLKNAKGEYINFVKEFYSKLVMQTKIEEIKSNMACTNEFFYMSGWIPSFKKQEFSKILGEFEDKLIVIYKEDNKLREGLEPPTCMYNGFLIKPFEAVVKLYGIPSYKEIDPTAFVGLSYMFLFGAMFGDVGQGLILCLIGFFLEKKKRRPNLGGVLARLGISSTFFGFLYGSIFGFETLIDAVLVRPMASIDKVLIWAVLIGVIMLTVGYIYNLINSIRSKDIENGVFSRNGMAGILFYWLVLYLIWARIYGKNTFIPRGVILIILILLLILMFFKEPLSNLIKGVTPLYSESKVDYYVEGGFGILETLLSMLSNTLSFIRVGAFAINHVGLFIAFETLAEMMSNHVESILMIIFGNIVIIALEGLIVFIQGLRLEYYELFSKFFSGTGYEYNPIKLN